MDETKINIEGDPTELKPGSGVAGYEYASNLRTEGAPIVDPATGKTNVIRVFEFKMNPDPKVFFNNRQHIFNSHARQIQTILWGDGLRPIDAISPRVIINKKQRKYQIFVPCEARSDVLFVEKPKPLSEQLSRPAKQSGTSRNKK